MLVHDYLVPRKTLEQLESIVTDLRARLGIEDALRVDVFRLLFEDMPTYLRERSLSLIPRSAGYMGDRDAYAVSKPNRIFYRPRLLAELKMGVLKARVEFLHELAHILLHPGAEKAWMTSGNDVKTYIPEEESAEWQATTFALCLLAPKRFADRCGSVAELSETFGIDNEHAAKRFDQIARRRSRRVPAIYGEVRKELARSNEPKRYVDERCSDCGECQLIKIDNKYRCANCGRVSDNFQDGDLIGLDLN